MKKWISKATLSLVLVLAGSLLLPARPAPRPPAFQQSQALWGGDRVRLMRLMT